MKTFRIVALLVVVGLLVLQNVGCDKMPTSATSTNETAITKDAGNASVAHRPSFREPYDGLKIVKTWKDDGIISYRRGGWLGSRNSFTLYVHPRTMSTHRDTYLSSEVSLTSENELIFNFKPDGLSFSKSAILTLNYRLLFDKKGFHNNTPLVLKWWNPATEEWEIVAKSERSNNYYNWDRGNRRVSFLIDHFSIYLISKD